MENTDQFIQAMNFVSWNFRAWPVRSVSPNRRETSFKGAMHVDQGVIAHIPSFGRGDAESLKRTFKNLAIRFPQPFPLRDEHLIHQVREAELTNLLFLHVC